MDDIAIRQAEDDELGAVAGLRWQWVQESARAVTACFAESSRLLQAVAPFAGH